jgi:hypothetical protein
MGDREESLQHLPLVKGLLKNHLLWLITLAEVL